MLIKSILKVYNRDDKKKVFNSTNYASITKMMIFKVMAKKKHLLVLPVPDICHTFFHAPSSTHLLIMYTQKKIKKKKKKLKENPKRLS